MQPRFLKAEAQLEEAEKSYAGVLTYFGEDTLPSEDFFGLLYRFHTSLQAVRAQKWKVRGYLHFT